MKSTLFMRTLAAGCVLTWGALVANAATINLTPTDVSGVDTNTAQFSDGQLTITPFVHDGTGFVQDTFNGNAARLGIDNNGTNNNAVADNDDVVGNAGDEAFEYAFSPTAGLSKITYDFSRAFAAGTNDGVVFTGFRSNPNVTFSIVEPDLFAIWEAASSTLRLNIPGRLFGGAQVDINFNNVNASVGETIFMTVNDTSQAAPQLAIRGISYDIVPEPASLSIVCLAGIAMLVRRKR